MKNLRFYKYNIIICTDDPAKNMMDIEECYEFMKWYYINNNLDL